MFGSRQSAIHDSNGDRNLLDKENHPFLIHSKSSLLRKYHRESDNQMVATANFDFSQNMMTQYALSKTNLLDLQHAQVEDGKQLRQSITRSQSKSFIPRLQQSQSVSQQMGDKARHTHQTNYLRTGGPTSFSTTRSQLQKVADQQKLPKVTVVGPFFDDDKPFGHRRARTGDSSHWKRDEGFDMLETGAPSIHQSRHSRKPHIVQGQNTLLKLIKTSYEWQSHTRLLESLQSGPNPDNALQTQPLDSVSSTNRIQLVEPRPTHKSDQFEKRIDLTDELGQPSPVLDHPGVFKLEIPSFSNEKQKDRTLRMRLKNIKKLSVNEAQEPKLAMKKANLLSKAAKAGFEFPGSNEVSTLAQTPEMFHTASQSQVYESPSKSVSRFVSILVLDRTLLAGSHLLPQHILPKPLPARTNSLSWLAAATRERFGLPERFGVFADKQGRLITTPEQMVVSDVLLLLHDMGLVRFLQTVAAHGVDSVRVPFGFSRNKVLTLYEKIEQLERTARESSRRGGLQEEALVEPHIPLVGEEERQKAVRKVFKAIEGDKPMLSSQDANELCQLMKVGEKFPESVVRIDKFNHTMHGMMKRYRTTSKQTPAVYASPEDYVESSAQVLENPELEKLQIICDLYERDQKGVITSEKDPYEVYNQLYNRLGQLMEIDPDFKFMGELEHSHLSRGQMIGKVLDEVLSKHFKGKYTIKAAEDEEELDLVAKRRKYEEMETAALDIAKKPKKDTRFIDENKAKVSSMKRALIESMRHTKPLVDSNIPKLQAELRIGRVELYSFYMLFKALSVVSSQILKPDGTFNTSGVHYDIWRTGIFQLNMMSDEMAKRVYVKIDESMEGILDWGEFLEGMKIINAKTKLQMIDLFLKLADQNKNGLLTFKELSMLSGLALKRYFTTTESEFFQSLRDYFARFIFDSCETPYNEKLEIVKIKELIVNSHPNSSLVVMFCGADL